MESKTIRKIAKRALNQYPDHFHKIEFFAKETSHIYCTYNSKNERFALKIHEQISSTLEDHLIEVLLLQHIQKNSPILVPQIIIDKKGKSSVEIYDKQYNIVYRASMTKWINSQSLKGNETKDAFIELGKNVAQLHNVTQNLIIPAHISPKKWNKVFYFRNEKAVYQDSKYRRLLGEEFIEVLSNLIPYLDRQLNNIYEQNKPQLIHADLNPWNVRLHQDKIAILDFEDAVLGFPIQDIAIILYYYQSDKKFSTQQVLDYLIKGYSSIREFPDFSEHDLDLCFMARQVNFLNYALTFGDEYQEFIQNSIPTIKAFEDRYL